MISEYAGFATIGAWRHVQKKRANLEAKVAELTRELNEAREQQEATSAVLRSIASTPTAIQPILDVVAKSAAKLCDALDSTILLREGEWLRTSSHYGSITVDQRFPIRDDFVSGRAMLNRAPQHIHDLASAGDEFKGGRESAL